MARKEVIQIRVSEQEKTRWKNAAEAQHLELSAWMRHVLDQHSRQTSSTQPDLYPPEDDWPE